MNTTGFVLRRKPEGNEGYIYLGKSGRIYVNDVNRAIIFDTHHAVFQFLHTWNQGEFADSPEFNGGDIIEIVKVVGKPKDLEWTLA